MDRRQQSFRNRPHKPHLLERLSTGSEYEDLLRLMRESDMPLQARWQFIDRRNLIMPEKLACAAAPLLAPSPILRAC